MMWFFAVLIVLVLGGVAMVAAGVGTPMGEEYGDRPDAVVPADRRLRADDLRRVRFPVRLRGYDMSAVDALLARLAAEAEERETRAEPGSIRGGPTEPDPTSAPDSAPTSAPESAEPRD